MIPDKIYVGVGTLSSIQPAEEYAFPGWQEKPYSQIRNEEYISKDALIEKLEKVAASYKKRSDEGELVWQNMCGIKEAIEILNKM